MLMKFHLKKITPSFKRFFFVNTGSFRIFNSVSFSCLRYGVGAITCFQYQNFSKNFCYGYFARDASSCGYSFSNHNVAHASSLGTRRKADNFTGLYKRCLHSSG